MALVKAAATADKEKAAALLETLRAENPAHWPYGLSVGHFDPGDLFLIRKEASSDPVGFVGWQTRQLGPQRVGLYSIGILPEYRHQGIAKAAVARLIQEKVATVDHVAAMVVDGNVPSEKLAQALGVPLLKKKAMAAAAGRFIAKHPNLTTAAGATAGGVGTAEVYDVLMPHQEGVGFWQDPARKVTYGLNALAGAAGSIPALRLGVNKARGTQSIFSSSAAANSAKTGILGIPLLKVFLGQQKSDMQSSDRHAGEANRIAAGAARLAASAKNTGTQAIETAGKAVSGMSPWALLGGAGLLTAGLGAGAYALQKAIRDKAEAPVNIQTSQGGRLRVTLPTTREGDSETVLDLPFDQENALSNSLRNRLKLDTRRRLYAETKARVRHRGKPLQPFYAVS